MRRLDVGAMVQIEEIRKAAEILKRGGLVAFPTETVYGLGARVFDENAVRRIFTVKGRPADNPLIVHVVTMEQLASVADEVPPVARRLIDAFWPGPLAMVLPRSRRVPAVVSAGLPTVAVRMPDHPVALGLIRELQEPIAAPSANRSGRPSPTRVEHVIDDLESMIEMVLDGGSCRIGVESTVIDLTLDVPCVLRPGAVTREMLQDTIGQVRTLPSHEGENGRKSPGLRHRHYAPRCQIASVSRETLIPTMDHWQLSGKRVGLLCRSIEVNDRPPVFYRRIPGSPEAYGHALFSAWFDAERAMIDVLLVEALEETGLGAAIMDRIHRAEQR